MENERRKNLQRRELYEKVRTELHAAINCQQALIGYFELGEYMKAATIGMECRSGLSQIIEELHVLAEWPPEKHES